MDINRNSNSLQTVIVLFLLVLTSLENGVVGQCVKNPVNQAVPEGTTNVEIRCAPNPIQLIWRLHPVSDEVESTVISTAQGTIVQAAQSIFTLVGGVLGINKATIFEDPLFEFSTGGIYVGEFPNKTRVVGAKLVVVRDGPVCSLNVDAPSTGDSVRLTCRTTYADHSVHPIRPFMTVTVGDNRVIAAKTLRTERINQHLTVASLSVGFVYDACLAVRILQTFNPPTDLRYKFIARNAPDFSNSFTFPATSENCLRYPGNKAVREGAENILIEFTRNPNTVKWQISPTSQESEILTIAEFSKDVASSLSQLFAVNKSGLIVRKAVAYPDSISTSGIITLVTRNRETKNTKLVVVRSGPTCSTSSTGGSNTLTCTVEFADHSLNPIDPYIAFKRNGVIINISTPPRTRKDAATLIATASFVVTNDPSAADECLVGFNPPAIDDGSSNVATNAPDFTASCNY